MVVSPPWFPVVTIPERGPAAHPGPGVQRRPATGTIAPSRPVAGPVPTMPEPTRPPRLRDRLLRDHGGELATAGAFALAWMFGAWLPDRVLLALVVAVALQFSVVTMALGAITPRTPGTIAIVVLGHAALFAGLAWIASAGGRQPPDLLACAIAQAPLVVRSIERGVRNDVGTGFLLEALGPFLLLIPVLLAAAMLAAILPDTGLHARELRFAHLAPLPGKDIAFALLAGAVYFVFAALGRVWFGEGEHRRAALDPAEIARWREDYQRSRRPSDRS
jgi:hypothetical protein